jgi:anti-sigma regulatory factor (Ser/Thr protein kinase)
VPAATLSIPPLTEHVRTVRLVAVAAARRAGLAEDVVDDVRLAVGEVVARAVLLHGSLGSERDVDVVIRDDGHDFTVEVTGEPASGHGDDDGDTAVSLALVHALVPEVDVHDGTVALAWPLASASA